MSSELPPANPNAHGLHLTDLEFEGLMAFVHSQSMVGKAWVYGSRLSGQRRPRDDARPPDIDLAVELVDVSDDAHTMAMFDLRWAACEFFILRHPHYGLSTLEGDPGCVKIEYTGKQEPVVAEFIAADGASLIFERVGETQADIPDTPDPACDEQEGSDPRRSEQEEKVAAYITAKADMERLRSYVQRGRRLAPLSLDELKRLLVVTYDKWAMDVVNPQLRLLSGEISAEYQLRKVDVPLGLVEDKIEIISKRVVEVIARLREDRTGGINEGSIDD